MRILIDADGCPVVDLTIRIAKGNGIDCIILIVRLSAKGTDGVMKRGGFRLFVFCAILVLECRHTTEHVEVSGGAVIAATPHGYMVSAVRKGINEWRKKQPVNLSLTNRLDFAGRPVTADFSKKNLEVCYVQNLS